MPAHEQKNEDQRCAIVGAEPERQTPNRSEQETEVERNRDVVVENGEGLGWTSISDFETKRVDNGGPSMR